MDKYDEQAEKVCKDAENEIEGPLHPNLRLVLLNHIASALRSAATVQEGKEADNGDC